MKDKISLVIKKPVSSDSGSSDKMDKKYHQISKELEVDLDHFSDKVSIRPYI